MGRGRQKAKHTKVARDLKYFSPDTNYGALQQELSHAELAAAAASAANPERLEEDLQKWPEYAGYLAEDDDELDDLDESKSA
ncbi:MAG: DUF3073 domain-containing protein [Pseudolysinimonas sp.]